jgi:hypothetical protein
VRLRLSGALDVESLFLAGDGDPWQRPPGHLEVAGDLEPPREDTLSLGVEYEVLSSLAVGAAAVRRSLTGAVATLSADGGRSLVVGTPGGRLWPAALESSRWEATAWLRRRLSGAWQASLLVQWSRSRGTWAGASAAHLADVEREYLRDVVVPEGLIGAEGPLPGDREWRAELTGSWASAAGPAIAGRVAFASGAPISRRGALADGFGLDRRFVDRRGAAGRTPAVWSTDVAVSWPVDVGPGVLEARLDLINLLDQETAVLVDERWSLLDELGAAGLTTAEQRTGATWGRAIERQRPLEARIGLTYRW